jgi:hypothetical protein
MSISSATSSPLLKPKIFNNFCFKKRKDKADIFEYSDSVELSNDLLDFELDHQSVCEDELDILPSITAQIPYESFAAVAKYLMRENQN